ncbi:MAG: DEAD/DEAH box helicase family protein [Fibrella sp.]|nr:DEAD/DEAH box helicase family protein [Armatimonadota bacterium]
MGAGKTFLMAAFIYLDLYFARNEPDNKAFAHNFILLAPSGLKSSIMPSLRTIENFDPHNALPEPAASAIRALIKFELLDQPKSASRSNQARNPNAQKISQHQPFADLMGLVMVTNAEKVILDKVKFDENGLFEQTEDERDRAANELRNLIGKIPDVQILIDEVHHAATDDIKLRQVVNNWNATGNIVGVLGFSGTPYLSSAETVNVGDGVSLKFSQITNTVFYYPLTRAIERFLKKPTVHTLAQLESDAIVRRGVEAFLSEYGDKEYADGQTAKLAIYCGSIDRLEESVYPLLLEMGIAPDAILKYHRGNPKHKIAAIAEAEFRSLDFPVSRKRIVLLVQIGKEGWDCRSLTGVILSQKGDCPPNMVLQTSCRCLRQMDGGTETAGIWLNADNAKILDKQLREEQQTSIDAINRLGKSGDGVPMRPRLSRADFLKLPPVDFYELRVRYDTLTIEQAAPRITLAALDIAPFRRNAVITTGDLNQTDAVSRRFLDDDRGEVADFSVWMLGISKGAFEGVSLPTLRGFTAELRPIFDAITYDDGGTRRFNALFDGGAIATEIRLAFHAARTLTTTSDVIGKQAHLLIATKLKPIAAATARLCPSEADAEAIIKADDAGQSADQFIAAQQGQYEQARELLKAQGIDLGLLAATPSAPSVAVRRKDYTFQYLPYKFDSDFEWDFLQQSLTLPELENMGIELYFNGEGELTEFRIMCYARVAHGWSKVGLYTPDYLLIERRNGAIYRALIVETKGKGYADQREFVARRKFVESEFLPMSNDKFGYARFDYLYLTDADPLDANLRKLRDAALRFFTN